MYALMKNDFMEDLIDHRLNCPKDVSGIIIFLMHLRIPCNICLDNKMHNCDSIFCDRPSESQRHEQRRL